MTVARGPAPPACAAAASSSSGPGIWLLPLARAFRITKLVWANSPPWLRLLAGTTTDPACVDGAASGTLASAAVCAWAFPPGPPPVLCPYPDMVVIATMAVRTPSVVRGVRCLVGFRMSCLSLGRRSVVGSDGLQNPGVG